jgi:hypothetical protein
VNTAAAKARSRSWVQLAAAALAARIEGRLEWLNSIAMSPATAPVSDLLDAYRTHLVRGVRSSPNIDETETNIAASGPKSTAAKRIGNREIETLRVPET